MSAFSPTSAGRRINAEEAIGAVAVKQHGVVTRAQLLRAGLSEQMIDRRLQTKRLCPLHRGVYGVGPVLPPRAREMAAVLACGDSGFVSHRSAGACWQVLRVRDRAVPVEVSIRRGDYRKPDIRVHRARTLRSNEVTKLDGIPITTPARTMFDLAATAPPPELERALAEALARRLTNQRELTRLLTHHPRHPGASRLRVLLGNGRLAFTRSEAEKRFNELIGKAQLPAPEVNVEVCGHEVDFFWRAERFVVEMDGFAFHSSARTFESDRRRDAELAAAGVRVIRVTWRQLEDEPVALVARLAQALARSGTR